MIGCVELLVGAPGRLAPHLHAPLQSGSDRVLKRMGRHWYTAATYAAAVERIGGASAGRSGSAPTSSPGFPGETEDDHSATVALVERAAVHLPARLPVLAAPGHGRDAAAGTQVAADVAPRRARPSCASSRRRKARALRGARASAATADVVVIGDGDDRARA